MKAIILIFFLMPLASHALIDCDLLKAKLVKNIKDRHIINSKIRGLSDAVKLQNISLEIDVDILGKPYDKVIEENKIFRKKIEKKQSVYRKKWMFLENQFHVYMAKADNEGCWK